MIAGASRHLTLRMSSHPCMLTYCLCCCCCLPLVQVSAAAQRAEAEAQKHLVVHAQVAAQAQELQQKAVHLQVGSNTSI
jgi:hypothetical protein